MWQEDNEETEETAGVNASTDTTSIPQQCTQSTREVEHLEPRMKGQTYQQQGKV